MEELLNLIDQRIGTLEEITAHLFQGYIELATMVESVIAQMVKPLDDAAAKEFSKAMTEHRAEMFQMVKDVAGGMVASDLEDAEPVEPVAE